VWGKRLLERDLTAGLCVGHEDPDIWFDPARVEQAREICVKCPVQSGCHLSAVEGRERHGVWGGADAYERGTPPAFRY